MAQVTLNRQKLGIEDLEWGTGTVTQTRGGQQVTITRVNAADIPYDDLQTLSQAIDPLVTKILPNLPEILLAQDSAETAAIKAAEAAVSEANTALLLDSFDDRYLGSKSVAPIVDNDGNALLVGALYFDTINNQMRVYSGTDWSDALTLTTGSISTLTNKTLDDISNNVGADHVHYKVRNVSGTTILKGTIVTAQGTQSGTDYIEVVPVSNPQTQVAIGVVHTDLLNNGTGLVTNIGITDDYVNTSTWAVGTILYPNTTGGLTNTKPASGMYQACAYVMRSHSTQGVLLVEFTEPKYIASTIQSGYVQLNNTLTSTSTVEALTASQGKLLQDTKVAKVTSSDNAIVRFDGTTGEVQNSSAVISDNGNLLVGTSVDNGSKLQVSNGNSSLSVFPHPNGVDIVSTGNFAPHYITDFTVYKGVPGSGIAKLRIAPITDNLLVGTATDDGANKLQVNGTFKATGTQNQLGDLIVYNYYTVLIGGVAFSVDFVLLGDSSYDIEIIRSAHDRAPQYNRIIFTQMIDVGQYKVISNDSTCTVTLVSSTTGAYRYTVTISSTGSYNGYTVCAKQRNVSINSIS